jgi:hypothetical protein
MAIYLFENMRQHTVIHISYNIAILDEQARKIRRAMASMPMTKVTF